MLLNSLRLTMACAHSSLQAASQRSWERLFSMAGRPLQQSHCSECVIVGPGSEGARAGAQVCTQRSWKRPFGVGLLVAGYDKAGAKLFYCCPSGSYYDYKAMAIGARSQARRKP